MRALSPSMRHTAQLLLTNKQGGPLAQMCITQKLPVMWKILGAVVVHTAAVLFSNSGRRSLLPFINMLTNPAALDVSACMIQAAQGSP